MTTGTTEQKVAGGAVQTGGVPPVKADRPGLVERLASVRLTLWLLAVLVIAMAVASFIPQNATPEAYLHVFGTLLGGLVAKTALRDIYNSWWFIGAFVLLALNLLACVVRRTGQLLRQEQQAPERVTRQDTTARAHRGQWRVGSAVDATTESLATALRKRGYRLFFTAGEEAGPRTAGMEGSIRRR